MSERKIILGIDTSNYTTSVALMYDDGELIAYVFGRLIAPEGEIYRIAVRADRRQRGVGYRLLSYALKTERGSSQKKKKKCFDVFI